MSRNAPLPLVRHPRIERLIGFNLQMATLSVVARTRDSLADMDISPAKATALALLQANPGCDQSALGRALRINRASAMKLINSLSARGLVERGKGRNLRTKALHLTAAGERLFEQIMPTIEAAETQAAGVLKPAEQEILLTLLAKLGSQTHSGSD